MSVFDLTMPWDDDCPSFMGSPNPKTYYISRGHENAVNVQMLEIPNHNGTHMDGERHMTTNGRAIGEVPVDELIGPGAVVDVSDRVDEYGVYDKDDILDQPVNIKEGDAVVVHTGFHRYAYNQPEADIRRYFLKHPGPDSSVASWAREMDLQWIATDTASMDHPLNNSHIKEGNADIVAEFEAAHDAAVDDVFPPETHMCMHHLEPEGLLHVENVGGDIDQVLNQRCTLGVFPWRMIDVESSPCRIVAFEDGYL